MQTYPTIRAAALAGLAKAVPLAARDHWEYGGLILKTASGYTYTTPITSKSETQVRFTSLVQQLSGLPEDKRGVKVEYLPQVKQAGIVSDYHVHLSDIEGGAPELFSHADILQMVRLGLESCYIGVAGTGAVYEALPGGEGMQLVYPDYPADVESKEDALSFRLFVMLVQPQLLGARGVYVGNIRDVAT